MDKIFYKKILVGVRFTKFDKGSIPLTDEKETIQLLGLNHPKGAYLKAHLHKPIKRVTQNLQECLIVLRGKVKLDIYTPKKKFIRSVQLKTGQLFILLNGGYGIHLLEDSLLIEAKNGPFLNDKILI